MTENSIIFLDTSIMIARFVHSPEIKQRISDRLTNYKFVATKQVCTFFSESKRLCRALDQTMIVRKQNPEHEDMVCTRDSNDWGEFN